jgi:hypothetical protein
MLRLTGGHDRRLDHGGAPGGVLGPEQAGDAGDVGARHGGAGHYVVADAPPVIERQLRRRHRAAVRGDHADAWRGDVGLHACHRPGGSVTLLARANGWERTLGAER